MATQVVEHTERECDIHGRTMFAETIVGNAHSKRYHCMACDADRQRARYHAIQDGTYVPTKERHEKRSPKDYGFCTEHFLVKNALGECAGCED